MCIINAPIAYQISYLQMDRQRRILVAMAERSATANYYYRSDGRYERMQYWSMQLQSNNYVCHVLDYS